MKRNLLFLFAFVLFASAKAFAQPTPVISTPNGTNQVCGISVTLTVNDPSGTATNIQWQVFNNGTLTYDDIPGATGPMVSIIDDGDGVEDIQVVMTDAGGLFATDQITLLYFEPAAATVPADGITMCDHDGSGVNDGQAIFDLQDRENEILGGQDPSVFDVTYHTDPVEADAGINAIPMPDMFPSGNQTIFARVFNAGFMADDTCDAVVSFDLTVLPNPVVMTPPDLAVCDPNNDGFAAFDNDSGLTTLDDAITGGDPTLVVTYHATFAEAQSGANPETDGYINTMANMQPFFARVIDTDDVPFECPAIVNFNLIVLETPMPNNNPIPLELCDDDTADGFEVFNLTLRDTDILGALTAPDFSITWYSNLALATDAIDPTTPRPASDIPDPLNHNSDTNTVHAVIINETQSATWFCGVIVDLSLVVNPLPYDDVNVAPVIVPYELCDDEASGSTTDEISIFTLSTKDNEITGGNALFDVSYHPTELDADGDTMELPDMYPNSVPATETIWARVEDINTGCVQSISFTLVVNPNPTPTPVPPYEVCDDDANGGIVNDGIGIFDLTLQEAAIINMETNVDVLWYETEAQAIIGSTTDNIMAPGAYESTTGESVWIRLTDNDAATATACFGILEVELIVHPVPEIPVSIDTITECDDDGDGDVVFDLTQTTATILGSQDGMLFTITYHESEVSADAAVGDPNRDTTLIASPASYTTGVATTIWYRIEFNDTLCYSFGSFELEIGTEPSGYTIPLEFHACDSEDSGDDMDGITTFDLDELTAEILAGTTDLTVTYYDSQANLDAGMPITGTMYQAADGFLLFMEVSGTTPGMCANQETTTLIVDPVPVLISEPLPNAIACDDDGDAFGEFMLDEYATLILNGSTTVDLSFYETLTDAENESSPIDITVPYNNINGMMSLFVVAADNVLPTACSKIFEFALEVHPVPVIASEPDDLFECDEDGDGAEVFDLTQNDDNVLGAQDATLLNVTYHETLASAITRPGAMPDDRDTALIADPVNYNFSGTDREIWVRVEYNDGSACDAVSSFMINVAQLPEAIDIGDQEACDDDYDGVILWDLDALEGALTNDNDLAIVTFYEINPDNTLGAEITNSDAYPNTNNPQVIQADIEDSITGCISTTTFTLRVLTLPSPETTTPDPVVICDDASPNDGLATFDLSGVIAEIVGTENVDVRVYEELAFAEADPVNTTDVVAQVLVSTNTTQTSYTNTIPGGQTLYARIDTNIAGNSCFVIVAFDVVVNPLPVLTQDTPYAFTICEPEDGDDSETVITDFDALSDDIGMLAPPQLSGEFSITYYEQAVQVGNAAFVLNDDVPYTLTEDGSGSVTLYFRVANNDTTCFIDSSVVITVESRPEAATPPDMVGCANDPGVNGIPNQDQGTFDLTLQDGLITGGATGVSVVYYASFVDFSANNPIAAGDVSAYQNVSNPQTIYAAVQNDTTGCLSDPEVTFDLLVEPLPYVDLTQEGGDICVDPQTGAVLDEIVLDATPETLVAGAVYSYAWTLNGSLVSIDPTVEVTQTGIYQVTVTATYDDGIGNLTSCDYTAEVVYNPISGPNFTATVVESSFNTGGLYTVEVTLSDPSGFGAADYEFAIDDGAFQSSLTFTDVRPGTHTVFGRRADGNCPATEVIVNIIDYPRFFTPNNDGFHDTWNILGIGGAPNLNAKIYIFDRFGKLLKQLSPTARGWDGNFNGQPMPSNDYWFKVEYIEVNGDITQIGARKQFAGHFTLKR